MTYVVLRVLAAPLCAYLLSMLVLGLGSATGPGMQYAYLQLGLLSTNRPVPVDSQVVALLAPTICLLYTTQSMFANLTCEKTALLYRQNNLAKLAVKALCTIAACVLLFVVVEVAASVFFDFLLGKGGLPPCEMLATAVVRSLVFFVTVVFENALYLCAPAFVGFLVTGCLVSAVTLNLGRLTTAALAPLFPTFHLYALSGGMGGLSVAMSYGYLGACSVGLGLWLVRILRRHDV